MVEPADATAILADLVAFDTTSRDSNLQLIGYIEDRLARIGASSTRVASPDGRKANLYATLGPAVAGGIVLSGHTDVVPVDGQPWTTDPWTLVRRGDRLYGRGTCDMKGFLALALAAAPDAMSGRLARPVHLASSCTVTWSGWALRLWYQVGCLGAPAMIAELVRHLPPPSAVIVGEPTGMEVVGAHKGIATFEVDVRGHEAHSSLPHLGISANMEAVALMNELACLAARLERQGDPGSAFHPPHATVTIEGGTAVNILARECRFLFDLRCPPGQDPERIVAPFLERCAEVDRALGARFPCAGVTVSRRSSTPAFAPEFDGPAERIARGLAGDNGPARAVAYAAEAGQFQQAGFATVICGPGLIEQAHQPDEYLEIAQMERGATFMRRLLDALAS